MFVRQAARLPAITPLYMSKRALLRIGRQSCEQARISVVGSRGGTTGGLGAGVDPLGGDGKLNVILSFSLGAFINRSMNA